MQSYRNGAKFENAPACSRSCCQREGKNCALYTWLLQAAECQLYLCIFKTFFTFSFYCCCCMARLAIILSDMKNPFISPSIYKVIHLMFRDIRQRVTLTGTAHSQIWMAHQFTRNKSKRGRTKQFFYRKGRFSLGHYPTSSSLKILSSDKEPIC